MTHTLRIVLAASLGLAAAPALALAAPDIQPAPVLEQDPGDDLDDILGEDPAEEGDKSVREERRELEEEADKGEEPETIKIKPPERKTIKTLQPKSFVKVNRFELVPYVGMITNDPFIRRILFGANLGYHLTEVLEVELQGSFSPNFGEGDWKPITRQIIDANQVSPEISRMTWHATVNLNFSPFYGKVATLGRNSIIFDIYGTFGAGVVGTEDDLVVIQKEDDDKAISTAVQVHPALTFGAGLRVAFNRTFALRFEVRDISYIGILEGTQLELNNNLGIMLGASIFFGQRAE